MSARKTPVLLRRSLMTGRINVLTRYTRPKGHPDLLQTTTDGKHDCTADFDAIVCELLLDPDSPDIIEILDGAAKGMELSDAERKQIRSFRKRLKGVIVRNNKEGHGTRK